MKLARICTAIIATLMFASICAAQCGPARPKGAGAAGSLEEMIVAQEQMIVDAIKKRDAEAFKNLVDMSGYEVSSHGTESLADFASVLFSPDVTFSETKMEEPKVKLVDKNTAVLTYKSTWNSTYKGKASSGSSYDTMIFVRRAGKWIAVFHQATAAAQSEANMTGQK
jgi:hypothetical protein